jgi:hypothetical protein
VAPAQERTRLRPLQLVLGVVLALLGVLDLAFAYLALSGSACGFAVSCAHPYYGFGWFRLVFGILLLVFGLMLIALSFRPRRWGGRGFAGPGGWRGGLYGPRGGGYGPRGMGGMAPIICPTCGGRNGPRFQYCRFCGAALGAPPGGPGAPLPPAP